jgi:prephenate dehydrogenase
LGAFFILLIKSIILIDKMAIDNKEPLVREIDDLVSNLMKFKYCIVNEDTNQLCELMKKGNKIKEEIG